MLFKQTTRYYLFFTIISALGLLISIASAYQAKVDGNDSKLLGNLVKIVILSVFAVSYYQSYRKLRLATENASWKAGLEGTEKKE